MNPIPSSVIASISGLFAGVLFVYANIAPQWSDPGDAQAVALWMAVTMVPAYFIVVLPMASWDWLFSLRHPTKLALHLLLGAVSGILVFTVAWGHLSHITILAATAALTGATTAAMLSLLRSPPLR